MVLKSTCSYHYCGIIGVYGNKISADFLRKVIGERKKEDMVREQSSEELPNPFRQLLKNAITNFFLGVCKNKENYENE